MNLRRLQAGVLRATNEVRAAILCKRAGLLPVDSISTMKAARDAFRAFGGLGGTISLAAARYEDRTALIDDRGALTFQEMDRRSNAIANAWLNLGVTVNDAVGIMARNHRGFFDAFFAAQKIGARTVLLNTDFSRPQLVDVVTREGVQILVLDEEFADRVDGVPARIGSFVAWADSDRSNSLEALLVRHPSGRPSAPAQHGALVILTSGTTGTPKGAARSGISSLQTPAALLAAMPIRGNVPVVVAPPVFHSMGFGASMLLFQIGATVVVSRRFDATRMSEMVEQTSADGLFLVPIMLARMLDARAEHGYDFSSLNYILAAGSQLGASLAERGLRELGPILHNMYGSTEVAYAAIAGPQHLAKAPNTVGPPAFATRIRLVDEEGRDVETGVTGRILVGNAVPFEGYTGGGDKERIDGLVATGDVGHFDRDGLLFVDGRDDSMIVSGGENVFPDEVEDLLVSCPEIVDAAVIGVHDSEYGQRLRAFVVLADKGSVDADGVRKFVRANLARYKVPRDVVFLDELPRTPTGKVLKRELPSDVPA